MTKSKAETQDPIEQQADEIVSEIRPDTAEAGSEPDPILADPPVGIPKQTPDLPAETANDAPAVKRRGRRKKKATPPEPETPVIDPEIQKMITNMPIGMMLKGVMDPFIMAVDERLPGLSTEEVANLNASGSVLMAQYGDQVAKYAPVVLFLMQMSGIVISRYLIAKKLKANGKPSEQQ